MNTKEKIEVMQAYLDGRKLEAQHPGSPNWTDWIAEREPIWNWEMVFFRIKPQDPIDEAYDRIMANCQFNKVQVDYESFKLGWEAREEAK